MDILGKMNTNQRIAAETTEGPVLIIAGPGTGKTFTLVKRIAYLVATKNVKPSEIMAVTFTEKAARELLTRISNEFSALGINENINDMYIGTFHSVCLRLMKEFAPESSISSSYRIADSFEATYLVNRNIDKFRYFGGFESHFPSSMGSWKQSLEICRYVSQLSEELADIDAMEKDSDPDIRLLAKITKCYRELLAEKKLMDFSSIQTTAFSLFRNNSDALDAIHEKIKYIMVDEYQDTNYIQEQLAFMLAGEGKNICVVGDDDQGMYRFRGATIRNILEFPNKFEKDECRIIHLDTNYRSEPGIIDFYSRWMENTDGVDLFNWNKFRYPKTLRSGRRDREFGDSVFTCGGETAEIQTEKLLEMICNLRDGGCIADLNQVAFLFRSVKSSEAVEIGKYLEENDIYIYSPRSEMFFERTEIKQLVGCMIMCFRTYFSDLKKNSFLHNINGSLREYYKECVKEATVLIKSNPLLHKYISAEFEFLSSLDGDSGKNMLDVFYRIVSFEPFSEYLMTDAAELVVKTRATRNLSEFSRIISRFSNLHNMHSLTDANIINYPEQFFNEYLKYLYIDGIGEYEDMSEYAPHGCVSFMTIHQSKGLEFPVVVTGSLGNKPERRTDPLMLAAETRFFSRPPFEPLSDIKYFDFWRLYYTAFSRAQDMLVLTHRGKTGVFTEYTEKLPSVSEFSGGTAFTDVKAVKFKKMYSFTSHIALYDGCPRQYKFYKEYAFAQHKMLHTSIGSLVHATLEDMNNFIIDGRLNKLTEDKLMNWFNANYTDIQNSTGYILTDEQLDNALNHVVSYYRNRINQLHYTWKAEEEIKLVLDEYILQGIIDLIEYYPEDDVIEIVDYKTGSKPDFRSNPESVSHYRKQLEIYAFLIQKKFGKAVRRMHLYYTSVFDGDPWVTFEFNRDNIDRTIEEVTATIRNIECRNFTGSVTNSYACDYCDMKFLCKKADAMKGL